MTPLKVAFIWHMHQPWYVYPGTREAALPFARLHACSAYHDMPWLLAGLEDTRATFNLVPSLAEQIARYARGEITDRGLELSRRSPVDLDMDERRYLLTHCCAAPAGLITGASPRYTELSHKRGLGRNVQQIECACAEFTDTELRDFQVWANLAWCGYATRAESGLVRELIARDRGFSEDEKLGLLDEMQQTVGRLLPLYRSLSEQGQAELTTSPYYHPILPLLCNMADAERRIPREGLPETFWHEPEHAQRHLRAARSAHEATFGLAPQGIWPSEGAVSDAALKEVEAAGFAWAASDEEVLALSLDPDGVHRPAPQALYRPYQIREGPLSIVFRDHRLSDLIGFVYREWAGQEAAEDMVAHLRRIADAEPRRPEPALVCIILDGENPWGWYRDGGEGFLRALYSALEAEPAIETTTVSEYLSEFPPGDRLESVFPGSWIDHSFGTWIGGEQHRRAWGLLTDALKTTRDPAPPDAVEGAIAQLMIAEGSDWFWWYSERHYSLDADLFDALFRANVGEVYRALGRAEPDAVHEPIAQAAKRRFDRPAVGLMQAIVDGRVSSYFEWQPAALLRTSSLGSAMHRSDLAISEVYIGHDLENLWIRVDTAGNPLVSLQGHQMRLVFAGDPERRLTLQWPDDEGGAPPALGGHLAETATAAVDWIIEVGISLAALGAKQGDVLQVAVQLLHADHPIERWPETGFLEFEYRGEEAAADVWFV